MSQKPIKMTEGFRNAKVKAGQLTEAEANGEWLRPHGGDSSPEMQEEFSAILRRVSGPASHGEPE